MGKVGFKGVHNVMQTVIQTHMQRKKTRGKHTKILTTEPLLLLDEITDDFYGIYIVSAF